MNTEHKEEFTIRNGLSKEWWSLQITKARHSERRMNVHKTKPLTELRKESEIVVTLKGSRRNVRPNEYSNGHQLKIKDLAG